MDILKGEIEKLMQSPDVLAVAWLYSLAKPLIAKSLGLDSGQQHQALPQHQEQQFSTHSQFFPQQAQTPHTPQVPQIPQQQETQQSPQQRK